MEIGSNRIEEIIVTTDKDELVATITDEDIVYADGYKVILRSEVNENKN